MSPQLRSALDAAQRTPLCPACQRPEHAGLCTADRCREAVLPTLKGNSLGHMAHSGQFGTSAESIAALDAAVAKHSRPKREASLRRQRAAADRRLAGAMYGLRTRNRSAA